MDRVGVKEISRRAVLDRMNLRPRQRGARGFLHHAAELPGEHQVRFGLDRQCLDGDDVAADLAHHDPGDGADLILLLRFPIVVAPGTQQVGQVLGGDDHGRCRTGSELARHLARDLGDGAIELTDTGFACVSMEHRDDGVA